MIHLRNLNSGIVDEFKERDIKTINNILATGMWERVQGRKDITPYSKPKPKAKKKKTKKNG